MESIKRAGVYTTRNGCSSSSGEWQTHFIYRSFLAVVLLFVAQHHLRADAQLALHSLDEQNLQQGEQMIRMAEFPDRRAFRSRSGNHVDAGYKYNVFDVVGVPLWTYDEQWCGYVNDTRYVSLNRVDLEELAKRADITLPDAPDLSFWYVSLGKLALAFAALVLAVRWIYRQTLGRLLHGNDVSKRQRDAQVKEAEAYAHDWRLHIVACVAKFAKLDGVVSKNELSVAEEIFESLELTGALRPLAINTFRDAKNGPVTFHECVQFYLERYQNESDLLQILVGILFAMAHADGQPNAPTRQALQSVCKVMGLDYQRCAENSKRRKSNTKPTNVEAAYTVLGCQPTDAPNVVKDRYRRLVKDFHPDTIMSKNLPAEFIKFAEERFKQIQAAYETIMEARTTGKT